MVEEYNNDVKVNGKITADVMESPNITALAEELSLVYKKAYPVGSIYMSTSSTSPAELFGGDWEEYAKGRVLVGLDTTMIDANTYANPEFNTMGKTGGTKTHLLTIDEMPIHRHTVYASTQDAGAESGKIYVHSQGSGSEYYNTTESSYAGNGEAHNNLQPYITVKIWHRTA